VTEQCCAPLRIGRLVQNGELIGYLAVDSQLWSFSKRRGLKIERWSECKRRYRLDLFDDWDDGFLEPADEDDLDRGRFWFRGNLVGYEETKEPDRDAILKERFSDWS
jgi:hypothetical protein